MLTSADTQPEEFRILTYNIQVGIGSHRLRHMILHGWRYVMPHGQTIRNLERISRQIHDYDIVGLNEADAGSFRTRYLNQAHFLANKAGYPYWEQLVTRDLGHFAQHTNSVLSRFPTEKVLRHRLPSLMDGRGVLELHYRVHGRLLVVLVTHLGLRRGARLLQMRYLARIVNQYPSVVLMGDFNCVAHSEEMTWLLSHTHLRTPQHCPVTFPSWRPVVALDHILASEDLDIQEVTVIPEPLSDHLALGARLRWRAPQEEPAGRELAG